MSYNFDHNILKLSETDDINKISKEWIDMGFDVLTHTTQCICNRQIKNRYRFRNLKNGNMINIGTTCYDKLVILHQCRTIETIFMNFIAGDVSDYENIIDLIKYSNENWISYLQVIKRYLITKSDYNTRLTELQEIISMLTNNGISCPELHTMCKEIQILLNKKLDEEIVKKEHEKRIRENRERNEREIILRNIKPCTCGLENKFCVCENPTYEVNRLNKKEYCLNCKYWKDRCQTSD